MGFRGAAINRFLDQTNDDPEPFIWTADPDRIIAAVRRGRQALDSIPVAICPSDERPARDERRRRPPG
jgi:hypothetical protein